MVNVGSAISCWDYHIVKSLIGASIQRQPHIECSLLFTEPTFKVISSLLRIMFELTGRFIQSRTKWRGV